MNKAEISTESAYSINPLVVEFAVLDWRSSLTFYTDLLGFEVVFSRPEEGFVFLKFGGAQIMFYQANLERNLLAEDTPLTRPLGQGVNLQIQVETIEPLVKALASANVGLALDPEERWYRIDNTSLGVRQFAVADPDGYLLRFSQPIGLRPASLSE
jgi:catechol 2,3-dioxygenase-like lactoylglutathione lyase family enzyme